ncbi:MAG: hypothetical protein K6F88_07990 [Ruminococcus sp.]|nr:hypothetical protein [Ruminococcus sp.]
MKQNSTKKYSAFQKVMVILIPICLLLLLASITTLVAMCVTQNYGSFGFFSIGNIVIIMASCSTILAIVVIVVSFVTAGKEPDDDPEDILLKKTIKK